MLSIDTIEQELASQFPHDATRVYEQSYDAGWGLWLQVRRLRPNGMLFAQTLLLSSTIHNEEDVALACVKLHRQLHGIEDRVHG